MRKTAFAVVAALAFAGCLSSKPPPAPSAWTVEPVAAKVARADQPRFGAVKLAQFSVRAPYDGTRLAVLRADGSIAFDAYNVFAAPPASLLRGAAADVMEATGVFGAVVGTAPVDVDGSVEITVTRLAFDCRKGAPRAVAAVTMAFVSGRRVMAVSKGEGAAPVGADGNFTAAFSAAFTEAVSAASDGL